MDTNHPQNAHAADAIEVVSDQPPGGMRNVTPGSAAPSAPKSGPPTIQPTQPMRYSNEMLQLLGRSPYPDPHDQVEAHNLRGCLAQEHGAQTVTQMIVVDDLTYVILNRRQLRAAAQAEIRLKKPLAAREILCPGWTNFQPPQPGLTISNGWGPTAFAAFMEAGGSEVEHLSDEEAIAAAISKLASMGLPEEVLLDRAFTLALPSLERPERLSASKAAEQEILLERLLQLKAHRDRKAALPAGK